MKKIALFTMIFSTMSALAGFGIQVGGFSPTKGIDDNDNSVLLGANLQFKLALIGIKIEGFYVDSSGRYENRLGESFGASTIDTEAILAADVMFYPVGTTFFLQGGVNYTSIDADELRNIDVDTVDNELGVELGLGVSLLDKLMLQGKIMYTPDAFTEDAVASLEGLDENLLGYMVTVGWQF